jgi:hypothetical protein
MSTTTPFENDHFEEGNVLVQNLTDWSGETEGMDEVESDWLKQARRSHITASVTEFGAEMQLGREAQNHLAEEWTENAQEAGIEKIAFVSEGIEARAVSANLDVAQEIQTFQSVADALRWARE